MATKTTSAARTKAEKLPADTTSAAASKAGRLSPYSREIKRVERGGDVGVSALALPKPTGEENAAVELPKAASANEARNEFSSFVNTQKFIKNAADRYTAQTHDTVREPNSYGAYMLGDSKIVDTGRIPAGNPRAGINRAQREIERIKSGDQNGNILHDTISEIAGGFGRGLNRAAQGYVYSMGALGQKVGDALGMTDYANDVKEKQDRWASALQNTTYGKQAARLDELNNQIVQYKEMAAENATRNEMREAMNNSDFTTYAKYNPNLGNDKDFDYLYEQVNQSKRWQNKENYLNSYNTAAITDPNSQAMRDSSHALAELTRDDAYSYLDPEQIAVFNYYYNKGEKDKALDFLNTIKPSLDKKRWKADSAKYQQMGHDMPITSSAASVLAAPAAGVGAIAQGIESIANGYINPYSRFNILNDISQNVRAGTRSKIEETIPNKVVTTVATLGYDVVMSMLESRMRAGMNVAGIGDLGLGSMALGVAQSVTNEKIRQGHSEADALTIGVVNGLAEYWTERAGMERLTEAMQMPKELGKKTIRELFKEFLPSMGKAAFKYGVPEMAEEGLADIIDFTVDTMVSIDRSEWGRRTKELQKEYNLSESDARSQALMEQWKELGLDSVAGFFSGALGGDIETALQYGTTASVKGAEAVMNRSADRVQRRTDREAAKISGEVENASAMSAEQWEASRKDQSAEAVRRRQTIRDTGERHGVSENTIRELQAASDRTGRNVAFTILPYSESASMNGVFDDDGNVLVNAKSNKPLHWILLHEFGHSIENSKEFNSLARLAVRHMYENGIDVEREIQKRAILYAKNGATKANPAYEMIMDWFGSNMGDSVKDIERLCNYDHGLGMRVWNYINEQLTGALGYGDLHQAAILNRAKEMYGRALSETAPSARRAWNTTEEPEYVAPAAEETEQKTAPKERTPEEIDEEYENNIGDIITEYAARRMTDEQYQSAIDELEQKYGYKAEFAGDLAKAKRKDDAYQKEVDKAIDDYNENKIDQEGFNKAIDQLEEKYGYKATELRPRKAAETEQTPKAQEAPTAQETPVKAEAPAEQAPTAKAETKTEEKAPAKRQITPQAGPPTAEMKMAKSSEPESYRQERASLGEQLRNGDIDAEEYGDRTDRLDDEYGRDVVADAEDAAAAYNVDENGERQYSYTAHEDGIDISNDTKSAYKYSYTTWNKSDYVQKRDEAAEELAENVLGEATDENIAIAKKWIDDVNGIASVIADDRTRLDYVASPGRSSFKSNAEYGGSIDSSTICAKRRLLTGTIDAIQTALGDEVLSEEDYLAIRNMMKREGHEVSCGLCYVESTRKNIAKYASQFLEEWNAEHPDNILHMTDVNTVFGLEDTRLNNSEAYDAYVSFMNKLAQRKPKLFEMRAEYDNDILKKFRNDDSVEAKNHNGGLRINSFSDFEIVHLIDMMQVITDMANVGLNGQAYTKVREFAEALGGTGLKINMSMICGGVDENGRIIFDEVEGMKWSDVEDLRDKYPDNVGTILVTFTDEQLKAALNDDRIDYIIPFHRSQWSKKDYALLGIPANAKDATPQQNERYIEPVYRINKNGKPVKMRPDNYMPNNYWRFDLSGKENAENYLRMCAENNRRPKFYKLLINNGDGSYSLQPDGSTDGYWKLLIDFKMYNHLTGEGAEQKPVRPIFDMDACKRMLNNYKGGHQSFPVAQDIVDSFANEYKGRGKAKYSNGKYTLEGGKFSITPAENEQYMEYARAGDEDRAEAMVYKAAKSAGAATDENGMLIDLYHGTRQFGFTKFNMDAQTHSNGMVYASTKSNVAANYAGRDHYAYQRNIWKGFKEGAEDLNDIIDNAKTVYGSDYKVITDNVRKKRIGELESDARKIYDRIEKAYPGYNSNVWQWDNEEYSESAANAFDIINGIFYELIDGDKDPESGYPEQPVIESLKSMFEPYTKYDPDTDDFVETTRYQEQKNTLQKYLNEHRKEITAINKDFYELYAGYDLTDTVIDIEYNLLKLYENNDLLINSAGHINDPYELQKSMDEIHNIGAYHLYGFLGDNPLTIDAEGASWLGIKCPELTGNDEYYSTDYIGKLAKKNNYTSLIVKNVYDGGEKADDYIFFNADQLKSADPITYDDDGEIIPLNERFNQENDDIRYSYTENEPQSEQDTKLRPMTAVEQADRRLRNAQFNAKVSERQAAADNIRLTAAERREMFGSPNSVGKVNTYATAKVAEAEGRGKQIIANSRDVGRAYENVGRAKGAEHEREGRENKLKLERAGRENKKQLEKEGRAEKRRIIKEGAPALDQMAKEKYAKAKERGYAAGYESGTKKANREYTQLVKQYEREMIEAEDRENAHVQLWEKARNQEYKPIESAADAVDMYNALKAARRAYRRISDYNELTPRERMFVGRLLRDEEDAATLFREKDIRYLKVLSEATAVYNYSKLGSMLGEYRGKIHTEANKTALDAIGGSEYFRKMRDVPQKLLASAMTTGRVFDYIAGNDYEMAERLKDAYVKPITRSNGAEERLKQRVKDRISALNIDKSIRKGNKVSEDYAVQFIGEKMSEIEALEDKESKWRKQHDSTISDIRSQLDGGVQKNGRPLTEKMRQNLEERLNNHESKEMPEYKNEAGQTLEELRAEVEAFKDANRNLDYNRIENDLVPVFREIYNDLFEKMNEARVANGYEPVDYRRGYFPHFTREDTSAMVRFAKSLGMEFDNKVLPTSIQGLTHEFRPGINWFSAAQERTGTNTDFSAQEGMDRYLEGVAKVIYRTENITKMRALANTIRRLADPKFDRFIKDVYSDKTKTEEEKYAAVEQKWRNELSDDKKAQRQALSYFVTWLDERTNIYAGKATNFDRLLRENLQVRTDKGLWKLLGFATDLPRGMVTRYGGNTVSINPGSWLTNFAPIFEVSAEVNPKYVLQALGSLKKDLREGFTEESNFLTARSGTDPLFTIADIGKTQMNHQGALKWLEGLGNVMKGAVNWGAKPMELIDGVTSYVVTRAYYLSNLDKGMSHDAALDLADNQAGDLMADRAPGKLPILMEIKNPIAKGFTQFQTEVLNSLEHNTHDVFGEIRKRYADDPKRGRAVIKSILRYMGFALRKSILLWLCNELYEALVGRRFMPDPIDWANEFRGDLTGSQLPNTVNLGINAGLAAASGGKVGRLPTAEDFMVKAEPGKAVANLGKNVAEELPIVGSMLGGGRIPVQQAVKDIDKLPKGIALLTDDDKENNESGWANLVKGLSGPLTYFVLPGGGTAVRRAVQAAEQYVQGGAFDVNGNLRYPLYNDNTLELVTNVAKVGLFGSTSSEAGQKWVDSGFDSFSKDATAAYIALTELGIDRRKAYGVVNKMRDVTKSEDESENTRKRAFIREQDIDGRAKAALYETMVLPDTAKARDVIDTLDIMGADMDKAMDLILGLADIDAKGYTVPDDSSKAAEKRKLLNSSRLDGDSKLEVYSNLILTSNAAKERDLISRVREFCDDGELVKVLTGLKESGKTVDDTRVLVESSLPDDVKEEVYKTMCVNADQVEKKESQIDAFREAGMGFNEYITAANKYAEINAQEDLKPVQKATEFARWADTTLGSGSSAAKENLKYSSGFSVEASGYEKMTDTGLSSDKAYDLNNQIAALTPKEGKSSVSDVQKAQVVASQADLSEEEKLKALRAVYSDSENSTYSKAYVANMYGVPLEDYFKIVDKCLEVDADPKYKDYKAQERTAAVLNSFKSLTNKQRAAIWQVYNTGWVAKNNPYDSSVGAYVRSLYYESDGKTKKETLPGGLSRSGSSSASAELTPPKATIPGGTSSSGSGQKVAYTPKLGVPRG